MTELRVQCARELSAMDFNGYRRRRPERRRRAERDVPNHGCDLPALPEYKPRYLMGVGRPIDLLESVARGIDLFDCVMPTRNGRNGLAFTDAGQLKLRNAVHRDDTRPLRGRLPLHRLPTQPWLPAASVHRWRDAGADPVIDPQPDLLPEDHAGSARCDRARSLRRILR